MIESMSESKNKSQAELTKRVPDLGWFHRYPARFPSSILIEIIETVQDKLGRTPNLLLDPFAGTGTTLSAARQMGMPSIGVELTHLGILIAQVRLNPLDNPETALAITEELAPLKPLAEDPRLSDDLVRWVGIENALVFSNYIERIKSITDNKLKNWLQVAISSALRASSCWLPGSIKAQVDPSRTPSAIGPNLVRAARALVRDCNVESRKFIPDTPVFVMKGDAQYIPLLKGAVDAVVTSPPYVTMYDYFDVQRLSYMAFGWPQERHLQIGRTKGISVDGRGFIPPSAMIEWYTKEYGGENTIQGRSLRAYLQSMRLHFSEIERVLRSGGVIAYAIANSFRRGRPFRLVDAFIEIISEFKFHDIHSKPRMNSNRRILPSGRDPKTGRFSSSITTPAVDEQVIYAIRK